MFLLGVSGSPIPNSNTDRALRAALDASGMESELIKLSDSNIAPCMACLGCVDTNECVIGDAGNTLAQRAREAAGMIVAGFTPYSTLDARSKTFLERLYPLRHKLGLMQGKPGGAIMTCSIPDDCEHLPPACQYGIDAVQFYMLEEGMEFMGGVKVAGNVPCVACGYGDECDLSGISMIHGPEATVASVGINRFEEQPQAMEQVRDLGRRIAEAARQTKA